jgi:hypothetical protein
MLDLIFNQSLIGPNHPPGLACTQPWENPFLGRVLLEFSAGLSMEQAGILIPTQMVGHGQG